MEDLIKNNVVDEKEEVKEVKTYTEEEVQKLLQAETDRKTTKALQTAKEKWEAEYKAKLEAEKDEATKLASMSAEERARLEFEKEKTAWEQQRANFLKEKMELETVKLLSSEGLPVEFSKYVVADDADTVSGNIKEFKKQWETAIAVAVEDRLKGRTPKTSSTENTEKVMSKQEFVKLPYKEREKLLKADPDLMKKLK